MMIKTLFFLLIILLVSCGSKNDTTEPVPPAPKPVENVFGVDISSLPMIEEKGIVYHNSDGEAEDVLTTLKKNGIDIIRLRLWHSPESKHSSLAEVMEFSGKIKAMGLKVWLSVHYSDTWADPGKQKTPVNWSNISFEQLKDSVYNYTSSIVEKIKPDIIQIGNEINDGFLHPTGKRSTNEDKFLQLLTIASNSIRDHDTSTRIMIHFAGYEGSSAFYNSVKNIDYDLIGISYYPAWHGKDMDMLKNTLVGLRSDYGKSVIIAETAYPFTLDWNDWTNNVIGLDDHLILPDYPATPQGQKNFIGKLKGYVTETNSIVGMCYWGGELVAFDGPESNEGSPWENQALYGFNNHALEVMDVIGE